MTSQLNPPHQNTHKSWTIKTNCKYRIQATFNNIHSHLINKITSIYHLDNNNQLNFSIPNKWLLCNATIAALFNKCLCFNNLLFASIAELLFNLSFLNFSVDVADQLYFTLHTVYNK